VLAIPVAVLIGFAFGAVGMAATSFFRTWQDFDLVQLVILPMFLFSGTFFPLTAYPEPVRTVIELTPLWQAVALERAVTLGHFDPSNILNVLYLVAMGIAGLVVVSRRIDRILLK
jgi:lipooligosaccharide transport system permease protein